MNNTKFSAKKIFNVNLLLMLPFFIISLILIVIPTIIILVYSFIPHYHDTIAANWQIMDLTTWDIFGWSFLTSFLTTLICIAIGFPFAYLLSLNKGKIFNVFALIVITSPIWSSTLFKLIGLKTMFDVLNGQLNSTYGDQYTLLGYVYIYLPLMTLPLYQVLEGMPKNYVLASQDLGASKTRTFFTVVLPYCKNALLAGVTLVFIPSMMIISVSTYMNNAANQQLLGGEIFSQASLGLDNKLSLSRASVISLVSAILLIALYMLVMYVPRWIKRLIKYLKSRDSKDNYYKFATPQESSKERKHSINEKLERPEIDFSYLKNGPLGTKLSDSLDVFDNDLSEGGIKE